MSKTNKKRKMTKRNYKWENKRIRLEAYRDSHGGDCNVPQKWKDDPQLGWWVMNQKTQWRKEKLSAERLTALEQMGAIKSWQQKKPRYIIQKVIRDRQVDAAAAVTIRRSEG